MKPLSLKEKAIDYRKRGYSYNMISQKLGLAKSTLSNWLHDIDFVPNKEVLLRIEKAKRNLVKGMYERRRKILETREKIKNNARREIKNLTEKDLWYVGAILYLAEGYKAQKDVRLTNSDPRVIKLFTIWLRKICKVPIRDFRAELHIYPDNSEREAVAYWSKITGIPRSQFSKTQIDRRIKKSRFKHGYLPYGTLHIRIRKSGELFHKILGWIERILEITENAGVV